CGRRLVGQRRRLGAAVLFEEEEEEEEEEEGIPDLTTTGPCSAWGLGVVTLTAQCADEREDGCDSPATHQWNGHVSAVLYSLTSF
ncbi:unnamed protein product, partial [Pylaiella littoralis]